MPAILPPSEILRAAAGRLQRLPALPADRGGPIAVAVSGGADSIYLLCALWADVALRSRLVVLHFDHRVRGEDSAEDARFVQDFCALLGVPCKSDQREFSGPASELELREARNAFFTAQRKLLGFDLLCTAHHLDDVVETLLLRLARGAGLSGLSAPRALQIFRDGHRRWRPLVAAGLTKEELLFSLKTLGLAWREDTTNVLPVAARNRVRIWLKDGGESALGRDYRQGFARSSRILGEAQAALATWAEELGCVVEVEGAMPIAALKGRPEALIREALSQFLYYHGIAEPGLASLLPLVSAIRSGEAAQSAVRGRIVRVQAHQLTLLPLSAQSLGSSERPLVEGVTDDECGLLAERVDIDEALWSKLSRGDIPPDRVAYLNAPLEGLMWRGKSDGDRYHPLGAPGSAKVSDLLINRKIPVELRAALPVVLARGTIVWVPGLPPAEAVRLSGPVKGALRLTWLHP